MTTEQRPRWNAAALDAITLDSFQAPPRFSSATFASYQPDPHFTSQSSARSRLVAWVDALGAAQSAGGLFGRFRRGKPQAATNLYLDGGFGVGKTHLLAATWRAASVARAYLSFQELTYVVGALGMARTLDLFGAAALICLDEFELDDPGNTMLATSFVRGVIGRGAQIVATSNTLPDELGRGRFNAAEFAREIGQLAAVFESIPIEGEDYRRRRFAAGGPPPGLLPAGSRPTSLDAVVLDWEELLADLARVHPIHYTGVAAGLTTLWLADATPIAEQDTALRFVHFADKLYDYRVGLTIAGDVDLEHLFPSSYGYGSFERKFRRCRSRLYEMLSEAADERADRGSAVAAGA